MRSARPPRPERPETYDVLGIGFGPSNLALAIALQEHNAQRPTSTISHFYLERQSSFGWHRGMLIDGPVMQVPFLKDLVTLRNPSSRFSFVSYLSREGRLSSFINRRSWFPSRLEFNDYLLWAAGAFDHLVAYANEVVAISAVWHADEIVAFDVHVQAHDSDHAQRYRARNLVIAVGSRPCMPTNAVAGERIWHSSELAYRINGIDSSPLAPACVVVAGAGQSAAEVVEYLHRRLSGTEIWALVADLGFRPLDDSPYVNTIFDPARVDGHFDAPTDVKEQLTSEYHNAIYSVVDRDLIQTLYTRGYEEAIGGAPRLRVVELSRLARARHVLDQVEIDIESRSSGVLQRITADMLVLATGYQQIDPGELLRHTVAYCRKDSQGRLRVQRDYSLLTAPEVKAAIYVQGPTENTHGATSTVLSNLACRAGEIAASIAHHCQDPLPHRCADTNNREGANEGEADAGRKRARSDTRTHR
jgi:L-ornithine N5-oxygenase